MIEIKVPATTANLGPGYDAMGMALNLYNTFRFSEGEKNYSNDNLIYRSFKYFYDKYNLEIPEVSIEVDADVPRSRGLGSSATCIVAGIMAANKFSGKNIDKYEILKLATEIEGHPDNVAPAIFGGLITSVVSDEVYIARENVSDDLSIMILVPDFELSTEEARKVVPTNINIKDAVWNISRAVLVAKAFSTGDFEMLKAVSEDKLHEPFRKELINGFDIFENIVKEYNGTINISGAGPSILVICKKENEHLKVKLKEKAESLRNWKVLELKVDNIGSIYK